MHLARKVYEKFLNGDPIDDGELKESVTFFKDLSDNLSLLGPVFRLSAIEANRVYLGLDGFRQARERKSSRPRG